MAIKQCSRCREFKPTSEFCRKARFLDGLNTWCRVCAKQSRSAYYQRNREKEIENALAWNRAHPTEARLAVELAHSRHRDRYAERQRERYDANSDPARARSARWKRENPERVAESCARRRAKKLKTQNEPIDYRAVWTRDGGRCHICGGSVESSSVHFDHVIPLAKGGTHTIENVRVAHPRCNLVKGASF